MCHFFAIVSKPSLKHVIKGTSYTDKGPFRKLKNRDRERLRDIERSAETLG